MILFVNDNKGFMFLGGLIELISKAYQALRVLLPNYKNQVLGLMLPTGTVYCRVCVDKLHIAFDSGKYITVAHARLHQYFQCQDCGFKISKGTINIRYHKIQKLGKQ